MPASSAVEAPWRIAIKQVSAQDLALQLSDRGFAAPLTVQAHALGFGFAVEAEFGAGPAAIVLDKRGLRAAGLRLASAGVAQPWFELDSLVLADGRLSTRQQEAALAAVTLSGGRLNAERSAGGELPLLAALQPVPRPAAPAASSPTWRYRVERLQLRDFGATLREPSVKPAAEFVVQDLQAKLQRLSDDLARALPLSLSLALRSGCQPSAKGQIVPGAASAALDLSLDELGLAPAQPYVAQATTLTLVEGSAASRGHLRWQPDRWSYDGNLDLGCLRIDEADTGDRLLNWRRLSTPELTVAPGGLRIGRPAGRRPGRQADHLRGQDAQRRQVHEDRRPDTAGTGRHRGAALRGRHRRVQVRGGTLDFADLSLALPFGARTDELGGELVGLSRSANTPTQVELEGQVNEYGLARANGQLELFDPTAFTDLKVEFRNVEMTRLTPYSATFAGRKIDSGKLSLDLEYKAQNRKLAGENQIVMDQLTLGERVESPDAMSLPLDLTVAILQDSDGRIDLGLPVSGDLDDPEFSYGSIIFKAIVNVLTKIVTAPFRALGALLGGGEETLDRVEFELGRGGAARGGPAPGRCHPDRAGAGGWQRARAAEPGRSRHPTGAGGPVRATLWGVGVDGVNGVEAAPGVGCRRRRPGRHAGQPLAQRPARHRAAAAGPGRRALAGGSRVTAGARHRARAAAVAGTDRTPRQGRRGGRGAGGRACRRGGGGHCVAGPGRGCQRRRRRTGFGGATPPMP